MPTAPKATALFLDDPVYWILCSLIIVCGLYASIFIHELGHWLFGRLCGFRILGFSVGEGKLLWRGKIDRSFVHLRLLPVEGYVIAVKDAAPLRRSQQILVSAGGPIFTALTLAAVAIAYHSSDFAFLGSTWSILSQQMLAVTMMLLTISLIFNLWPRHGNLNGQFFANDGMQILAALLSKNYPAPAWYQAQLRDVFHCDAVDETPGASELFLTAQTHHMDGDAAQAMSTIDEALGLPGLTTREQAFFLSLAAKFSPQTRSGLDHALECNERGHALFPDLHHFACELALTQIRLRFYDRGRAVLEEVLAQAQDADTRATAYCTLALADAAQNRREEGLKKMDEARKLTRYCPMLPIARAALLGGTPGFDNQS
ncbi:MAG: tetratricopeptide (TPR) repeat protein [Verrucomicrobiales bacterium]|jgi:tetratricopeptide (TPR) repeat protein